MNERIKKLLNEATSGHEQEHDRSKVMTVSDKEMDKFAELIVRECGVALSPMLRDMISRGQAVDLIKKHFGVES
jgi:hypothetical protein